MSENACGQVIMWYWKQRQQPLISEKCHGVLCADGLGLVNMQLLTV